MVYFHEKGAGEKIYRKELGDRHTTGFMHV